MSNNELIEKLSNLKLEETSLKRELDKRYGNIEIRTKLFNRIKAIKKEKAKIEFMIKVNKEIKNEKSR